MANTHTGPVSNGADWRVLDIWLPDEKYLLSQKAGYDVGVPDTIDHLLISRLESISTPSESRSTFQSHLAAWELPAERDELVSLYFQLASTNQRDPDAPNAAKGELVRFGARHYSLSPVQVQITRKLVQDYVAENSLEEKTCKNICERVGLPY